MESLIEGLKWIGAAIAGIIIVGVIVEALDKGVSNLSRTEEIWFILAIIALLAVVVTS